MTAPFLPVIAPSLSVQNFDCAVFVELRHVFYIALFLRTCAWFSCSLGMRPKFWIHESLGYILFLTSNANFILGITQEKLVILISLSMFGGVSFAFVGDMLVDPVLQIEMASRIRWFSRRKETIDSCLKHQLVYTFCDDWYWMIVSVPIALMGCVASENLLIRPVSGWSFPANLTESHRSATDRNVSSQSTWRRRSAYGQVDATGAVSKSPTAGVQQSCKVWYKDGRQLHMFEMRQLHWYHMQGRWVYTIKSCRNKL